MPLTGSQLMNKMFYRFTVGAVILAMAYQAWAQTQRPNTVKPEPATKSVPTILVRGPVGIVLRCAAEGEDVYWLEDDKHLLHVDRGAGGYPKALVRTNTEIEGFVADATAVYYLSQNKYEWGEKEDHFSTLGELRRINKKDGSITTLLPDVGLPTSTFIAADANDIYVFLIKGEGGMIMRVPKNGGESQRVASGIAAALSHFVIDERNYYWLDPLYKAVVQVARTGGGPKTLFRKDDPTFEPAGMIGDEKYLYVVTRKNDIYRVSKEDGATKMLYSGNAFQFYGPSVAVDRDYIYWRENNDVLRMSKADGKPVTLSSRNSAPTCMTVDDKYVYWFEADRGLVRLDK
jgi:hypothetical protein